MRTIVCILSGGLDSSTLAYSCKAEGFALRLLSFDYGQRHATPELNAAREIASRLHPLSHRVVDLKSLAWLLPGSALTDNSVDVPHGHYAAESMKRTIVPNRNMIMLAIAAGHAQAHGAEYVAFGAHATDRAIYPDCRPEFTAPLDAALSAATEDRVGLIAPFIDKQKSDIVALGAVLGVPFELTYSCYEGLAEHCGRCGTCTERREAFQLAGVIDPTSYASERTIS